MHEDLPSNIGQILMLTTRDFQRRLDRDLKERGVTGVGRRHREVILYLGRHGASRSVDLAHAANIRPQSMMTIIRELEELGFIERRPDPEDSRAKLITFTTMGEQFIEELGISTRAVWDQFAQLLGEKKLQTTIGALQQMLQSGEKESKNG